MLSGPRLVLSVVREPRSSELPGALTDAMLRSAKALREEGIHPDTLKTLVATGELHRVRHGVYAGDATPEGAEGHRRLIDATMPLLAPESVVSHHSAAVLHQLPVWLPPDAPICVTRPGDGRSWRSRHVRVRTARLPPEAIVSVAGHPVTALEQTLCDHARHVTYPRAVAVFDAGLRAGADRQLLGEIIATAGRGPGVGIARRAWQFADPAAENPGESISRVMLDRVGLPTPHCQREIRDPRTGEFVARADFAWDEQRIVGEFDGRMKYAGTYGDPAEVVMAEKAREQRLREAGWGVIRWTWAELSQPEVIRRRWESEVRRRA